MAVDKTRWLTAGIDIGSVSLSVVTTDTDGHIASSQYAFHHGRIPETLQKLEEELDLSRITTLATTSKNWFDEAAVRYYDPQTAVVTAGQKLFPGLGSIMLVGAEKFQLINFNDRGKYEHTATNTSCAVGTGSFLDQQASRLNLSDIEEFCRIALSNKEAIPDIASRCSVFAKTDLIHAQQEGYSLGAICDSLCQGLAKNIVDTLFSDESPREPMLFAGGVSQNQAVARHIEKLLNINLLQHELAHVLPAYGACLLANAGPPAATPQNTPAPGDLLVSHKNKKEYYHSPLNLALSKYPDMSALSSYRFSSTRVSKADEVLVDEYQTGLRNTDLPVYLGIDIGSTSTKAIICNEHCRPVAGFYTYTAGQPVDATRCILEAIDAYGADRQISLTFAGVGTTGSGRKFIGSILNADLVVDEITTHARAAYELNPRTDTIIEIGGQDSKFTLMKDGMVTFAQMNSVCAAGTGSFIEEQAKKLNIPLSAYSDRAEGSPAPLSSDRCTVFMERDLNNYLNRGYSVDEVLASVLHSVRENYLKKVAVEAAIGEHVCFQGATAKNKALVAAFEEKLGKEIYVSKYCHLTGALGLVHMLAEETGGGSDFRGLGIYRESIPVELETCRLCNNNCRIRLVEVGGEKIAYGFLCGRDYDTEKFVDSNTSGFDLLRERKKHFRFTPPEPVATRSLKGNKPGDASPRIGLPAALHLFEELSLWKYFFSKLSLVTLSSESAPDPVKTGKRLAGAEFCAPMEAMYGHVSYLEEKADYIFLPVYLEARDKKYEAERSYCYYTQFSPVVISGTGSGKFKDKLLSPLLNYSAGINSIRKELWECLRPLAGGRFTYNELCRALDEALHFYHSRKESLTSLFANNFKMNGQISVVLLGRPYLVLSRQMNKGIPGIFGSMGIRTCFQDMIPYDATDVSDIDYLLKVFPWYYAAGILEAAKVAAVTKGLYPVLVTAFKCAPDSFLIDYFKKIMEAHRKPYLVLQTDEHDSNVGYETRIEAAVRSFRNHAASSPVPAKPDLPLIESPEKNIHARKTLIFPNWDPLVAPLLVANLVKTGLDARLLEPDETVIRESMVHNTGQCLPINIITQEFIEYIEKYGLDPADTMLWMVETLLSCNIRMYPYYIREQLVKYGKGMEQALIYSGDVSHLDISLNTCLDAYLAYMIGGLLRRIACKIRPCEQNKGDSDAALKKGISIMEQAFLGNAPMEPSVIEAVALFDDIAYEPQERPRVAIFGDLYVRDNDVFNQDLIRFIEEAGGEVLTTPYHEYARITSESVIRRRIERGKNLEAMGFRALLAGLKLMDKKYYKHFRRYLGNQTPIHPARLEKHLKDFNVKLLHSGESYDNLLKIFYILQKFPDVSLFVQTNPAFCCPSLITEAMRNEIRRVTGVPVVSLTYDGTSEQKNDVLVPYLQLAGR